MRTIALILGLSVAVLGVVAVLPLILIWSLNSLFGLGIVVSIPTWIAALVLIGVLTTSVSVRV